MWAKDSKDGYYNVSVNESEVLKLCFIFEEKIYFFQRLQMGSSSSLRIFTEFMRFPTCAIKLDRPDLYYVNIDPDLINLDNFISDADVCKSTSSATLAMLFYYLDDILGGHPLETKAWEQFNHSGEILKNYLLEQRRQKLNLRHKFNSG